MSVPGGRSRAVGSAEEAKLLVIVGGLVFAVRLVYCGVLLLSSPLIFLPGAKITELWLFGSSRRQKANGKSSAVMAHRSQSFFF